jgi:hypothetical protein
MLQLVSCGFGGTSGHGGDEHVSDLISEKEIQIYKPVIIGYTTHLISAGKLAIEKETTPDE